jgi:hypothetical protein
MGPEEMQALFERHRETHPSGKSFVVPFANVTPFRDGLMAGESIYFDLASLCDQAALSLDQVRAGAEERRQGAG